MAVETLSELVAQEQAAARAAFIDAAWRGRPAAELLRLAEAAGLTVDEAEAVVDVCRRAHGLIPLANDLAKRERAHAAALKRASELRARADQLDAEARGLRAEAEGSTAAALAAVGASQKAVNGLLRLNAERADIVTSDRLPRECHARNQRHHAAARAAAEHAAKVAHDKAVAEAKRRVAGLEHDIKSSILPRERVLEKLLAKARELLAELEAKS